ncbi:NACHT domain-containing protein [Microcoleus vaginatus]|uniref:NACHT domain-containing protein n=1 Tax=Microcoleus vaginatus TaxID=119532 RepID=UPI001F60B9D3|nr:NACHT domain-containing protein [Microcoleus vaginatus HSN003]
MKETRKRGIRATEEGRKKLTTAKAAKRNHNDKVWTYLDIATAAEVNETTVKRFFRGEAVDRESAISICKALGLEVTDIVDANELNPPTSKLTPTEIDWREICDKVVATQQLRRQATAQQYELNIYVPLGLMERPKTPNPIPNPTGEESRQKEPELQIVQTYKDDAFFQKVIAENRTEKGKHIAIIGEPGAGKTTLLGELAERLPKNSPDFPICIRLADLRESTIEDYLLDNWLKKALYFIDADAENVTPEIRKALKQLFCQGKVWLLLDAVDEMAAESPVQALAKIREQLTDWLGKARVVLTCRLNVWDATISNTLTNFETYKTLEFEPDDVDKFIHQWFEQASQDEKRRNSGNESFWQKQGKQLQQQLKASGKERIRELVRNPLRLSMLCQSWCVAERDLPSTKAALYEQFTTYFFEWKQEEFQKKHRVLKETDKKQIQQALAKLALAAMESANRFRIEQEFAIEQMEEQWFDLADELGWLVLVDRDTRTKKPIYAFFHPTFQEYFAACAIGDWHFFLNHQIPPVSSCSYLIFERQWREVILLWLGRKDEYASPEQRKEFIDALQNFQDDCQNFYRGRSYLLAAVGVAEFIDHSDAANIVKAVAELACYDFDDFIEDSIAESSKEALLETDRNLAIIALISIVNGSKRGKSLKCAVQILSKIGCNNDAVITALTERLSILRDEELRWQFADSLIQVDASNLTALNTLSNLLEVCHNEQIIIQVIDLLGKITCDNFDVIYVLKNFLQHDSLMIAYSAAQSLKEINPSDSDAISVLKQLEPPPFDFDAEEAFLAHQERYEDFLSQHLSSEQKEVMLGRSNKNKQEIAEVLVSILNTCETSESERIEYIQWFNTAEESNGFPTHSLHILESELGMIESFEKLFSDSPFFFDVAIYIVPSKIDNTKNKYIIYIDALSKLLKFEIKHLKLTSVIIDLLCPQSQKSILSDNSYYPLNGAQIQEIAKKLVTLISIENIKRIITSLKNLINSLEKGSREYSYYYTILWHYAQKMPYPDFYQAWHQATPTNSATANLNLANLP